MKIHVVGPRAEIGRLDPEARVVHLTYHPTALVFLELIKRCPRLEAVQVPPSRINNVSKPSMCLLKVQKVKIFEGLILGHRTDLIEYYTVDEGLILQRAEELQAEGLDSEEVVAKVSEEVKVSPGLVGFIIEQ